MKSVFDPKYILEFIPKLVEALPVTLLMTAVAMVGGLLLGFVLAIIKIKKVPVLRQICALYVLFMRGTPLLAQLFLSYYHNIALQLLVVIYVQSLTPFFEYPQLCLNPIYHKQLV